MPYNSNISQQQLQDLFRQYQQLINYQMPQVQQTVQQPLQIPVPVQSHQVQYVEGISGARLYQDGLTPNSSEIIMDKDDNIFYLVSKDANGTPSKKIPKGKFVIEEDESDEPNIITRKDFDDFKEEIRQLLSIKSTPVSSTGKTITGKIVSKEENK